MLKRQIVNCTLVVVGLVVYVYSEQLMAQETVFDTRKVKYDVIFRLGLSKGGDDVASWTETFPSQALIEEIQNLNNVQEVTTNPIVKRPGEAGGDGLFIEAGVDIGVDSSPYSIEISIGHQSTDFFDLESGPEFNKQLINIIPTYHSGKHAIGLGLTYHLNPKLTYYHPSDTYDYVDDQLGSLPPVAELEYKNSFGTVIQYTYGKGSLKYGIRATFIDYESDMLRTLDAGYNESNARLYSRTISAPFRCATGLRHVPRAGNIPFRRSALKAWEDAR